MLRYWSKCFGLLHLIAQGGAQVKQVEQSVVAPCQGGAKSLLRTVAEKVFHWRVRLAPGDCRQLRPPGALIPLCVDCFRSASGQRQDASPGKESPSLQAEMRL